MEALVYTAFVGDRLLASGPLEEMLRRVKAHVDRVGEDDLLVFRDRDGRQVDFDWRGTADEVVTRATPKQDKPGPGRPKLGVTAREVTLLPQHWEWLEEQPNGVSATLRRLVEDARKRHPDREQGKRAAVAAGNFLTAMAGNRENFEEAYRALYRGEGKQFATLIKKWPKDVRTHATRLAAPAFAVR